MENKEETRLVTNCGKLPEETLSEAMGIEHSKRPSKEIENILLKRGETLSDKICCKCGATHGYCQSFKPTYIEIKDVKEFIEWVDKDLEEMKTNILKTKNPATSKMSDGALIVISSIKKSIKKRAGKELGGGV